MALSVCWILAIYWKLLTIQRKPNNLKLGKRSCCLTDNRSINPRKSKGKIDEVRSILRGGILNVVGVSETWLKGYISSKVISVNGYKIIRNDRQIRRGGGVMLYISEKFKTKVIRASVDSPIEYLFVEIEVNRSKVLIGIVYRPPDVHDITDIEQVITSLSVDYQNVLLMGDFNHDLLSDKVRKLVDLFCESVCLESIHNNFKPTHIDQSHGSLSLIDYFLTVSKDSILFSDQFWIPGISDHSFIYVVYDLLTVSLSKEFFFYNFNKVNNDELNHELNRTDFSAVSNANLIDDKITIFNSIVLDLFQKHVPLCRLHKKDEVNPWYNVECEQSRQLRDLAHQAYVDDRTEGNKRVFRYYRNKYNGAVERAKFTFGMDCFSVEQDSRSLWKKINGLGVLKDVGDEFNGITNTEFCDHFSSIQSRLNVQREDEIIPEADNSFKFHTVDESVVTSAINAVKSGATGIDDVRLKFIKLIWSDISDTVTHIFNSVLSSIYYPNVWKTSLVCPVAKKTRPMTINDFRPISLLPSISKALEIVMKEQMMSYVQDDKSLNDIQSGFRPYHSTTTALLGICDDIRKNIDHRLVTFLLLLDFSKAFDRIDHSILCRKLKTQFNFSSAACNLVYSYLSNRDMCVRIGDDLSDKQSIHSGVPQGSVLGPILFTFYINDITTVIKHSRPHQFADDLQIYKASKLDDDSLSVAVSEINVDVSSILEWSFINRLDLNAEKSQAIVVYNSSINNVLKPILLNGILIPYVDKVNNLGLIMNSKFTWDDHIAFVCSKVYGMLRKLSSISEFMPRALKRKLIISLVVPHFLYCDSLFSECSAQCKRRLEVCFNSCVRFIYGLRKYDSIGNKVMCIFGYSLFDYYNVRLARIVFKILLHGQPFYLFRHFHYAHSTRTRTLLMPAHSSSVVDNSFVVRSIRLWNSLPRAAKFANTFFTFKNECAKFFKMGGRQF